MGIMFNAREVIDNGGDLINYPTWHPDTPNPFMEDVIEDETFEYNANDVTFASDDSYDSDEPN